MTEYKELDKIILNIDSENCNELNNKKYIKFDESFKNCKIIKTIKCEVILKDSFVFADKDYTSEYIYIKINNFDRITVPQKKEYIHKFKVSRTMTYSDVLPDTMYYQKKLDENKLDTDIVYDEYDIPVKIFEDRQERIDKININKYYESIYLDEKISPGSTTKKYKTEVSGTSCNPSDINSYKLDDIEINRIDIELYNRDHELIDNSYIEKFITVFVLYYDNKKTTMI